MVSINELWIGEKLINKSTGEVGVFNGSINGKVKLDIEGKVKLIDPKLLDFAPEISKIEFKIKELDNKLNIPNHYLPEKNIDLHIEKLNPNLIHALPERIVDFQLNAFESFLKSAKQHNINPVTIIHGKGSGTLRLLVHGSLSSNKGVRHFHLVNNDGATEVYFK